MNDLEGRLKQQLTNEELVELASAEPFYLAFRQGKIDFPTFKELLVIWLEEKDALRASFGRRSPALLSAARDRPGHRDPE